MIDRLAHFLGDGYIDRLGSKEVIDALGHMLLLLNEQQWQGVEMKQNVKKLTALLSASVTAMSMFSGTNDMSRRKQAEAPDFYMP